MTRRMKTALCVLLIAAILSTAAIFLLSGSGNGYEAVFKAAVKSITEAESVTVKSQITGFVNGEKALDTESEYQKNGHDEYNYEFDRMDSDGKYESYVMNGSRFYNIDHENKTYESHKTYIDSSTPQSEEEEDEREKAVKIVVRLVKLFSDFCVGNAKNQFVREPVSGGSRYVITLKKQQLPDLALLMLDLFNEMEAESGIEQTGLDVAYMDYEEILRAEHLARCAEEMDEKVFDLYYHNKLLRAAYNDFKDEVQEKYMQAGREISDNGLVLVEKDGTYEVYSSLKDMYMQRLSEGKPIINRFDPLDYPKNADIKYVHGEFDVSDEGFVTRIYITGEGSVEDIAGKTYTGEIEILINLDKYNETEINIEALDGYTAVKKEKEESKTVWRNETVKFLGKKYFVHYAETAEE